MLRGNAPSNWVTIQKRKITHLEFRWPPTDNGPHNNQLKIDWRGGGGNIGEEVRPGVIT